MKRISILLAFLLPLSLSAAEIVPEKGVTILYINQLEAESQLGSNSVNSGFNQVVIRMDKKLGRGSNEEIFTSKPYVLNLDITGEEVRIDHPVARSVREAELAFSDSNPKWDIEQDGAPLVYKQEELAGKSGLLPYLGLADIIEKHNTQRGIFFDNGQLIDKPVEAQAIAVAATTTAAVTSTSSKVEKTSPAKPVATSNVEQLKAWYLKASKEERKAFRRWMIDQE
ncbi:DUF2057 family protein [Vibrio tubiashii]|uniref:DUF2057 family protein n=1 Tax=Vibrio tubiashii TaxID=29498 RepID=UPI00349E6E3B